MCYIKDVLQGFHYKGLGNVWETSGSFLNNTGREPKFLSLWSRSSKALNIRLSIEKVAGSIPVGSVGGWLAKN